MKILPSDLCTDAEFFAPGFAGSDGSAAAARARCEPFWTIKARARRKRERLIDELIASPDYIKFWANKWADLLQCNSENLGKKAVWVFKAMDSSKRSRRTCPMTSSFAKSFWPKAAPT